MNALVLLNIAFTTCSILSFHRQIRYWNILVNRHSIVNSLIEQFIDSTPLSRHNRILGTTLTNVEYIQINTYLSLCHMVRCVNFMWSDFHEQYSVHSKWPWNVLLSAFSKGAYRFFSLFSRSFGFSLEWESERQSDDQVRCSTYVWLCIKRWQHSEYIPCAFKEKKNIYLA